MSAPYASLTRHPRVSALLVLTLALGACDEPVTTAPETPAESPSASTANTAYAITDLGMLYRGTKSEAKAINDAGIIVGVSETLLGASLPLQWRAFRYENGVMSDLGTLPGLPESEASDINSSGWIVGNSWGNLESRPFLWKPGQGMLDLGHLDNKGNTVAHALNDYGVVVGASDREDEWANWRTRAFRWTQNGGMIALGANHEYSWAYDVNNLGYAVGAAGFPSEQHAYMWDPAGNGTDIGTLGGAYSIAYAINDMGFVIGESETTNGEWHAFRWAPWIGMVDLGAVLGYFGSTKDLSAKGRIVGSYYNMFVGSGAATVFGRSAPVGLGGFHPSKSSYAHGVNKCGTIVGSAVTLENRRHATVWARPKGVCD